METALQVTPSELEQLRGLVEGYLTPDFIKRCHQPVVKRKRGVVLD